METKQTVLTGQSCDHLVVVPGLECQLHPQAVEPLLAFRDAARAAGFDLAVASSFRSFDRQCVIWNNKAAGRRPVLDDNGRTINLEGLNSWEQVQAILRWSALPGASRHHWGTDLDVFDRAALGDRADGPALTADESAPGGVFYAFHQWLDRFLAKPENPGFYRPYAIDRGGVGPEPWHISYRPLARQCQQALSPELLREVLASADIALRDTVLHHLDEIFNRFVRVPC